MVPMKRGYPMEHRRCTFVQTCVITQVAFQASYAQRICVYIDPSNCRKRISTSLVIGRLPRLIPPRLCLLPVTRPEIASVKLLNARLEGLLVYHTCATG